MELPKITVVTEQEQSRVYASLLLSFSTDPLLRWLWPEAGDYVTCSPAFLKKHFVQKYKKIRFMFSKLWMSITPLSPAGTCQLLA